MRSGFLLLLSLPGALGAQPPRALWTLEPDVRIGSVDAQDYTLTSVSSIEVGPDGEMYVAQSDEGMVRVYDASGLYLRSIGRRGDGPGELRSVDAMGWKGDSLWVVDIPSARVTFFSARGRTLQAIAIRGPMLAGISSRPTHPRVVASDGSVLGFPFTGGRYAGPAPLLRMDRAGALLDEIGSLHVSGNYTSIRATLGGRPIAMQMSLPIQDGSMWAYSPRDSAVVLVHRPTAVGGDPALFRVEKLRSSTDTVFARRYRYRPKPISPAAVDSALDRAAGFFARHAPRHEVAQLLRDSIPIPRYQSPITELVVGRDGTIWLRREAMGTDEVEWLVLDADGRIIAELNIPPMVKLLAAERGRAWGVVRDELDVPYVVRYRVRAAKLSANGFS